MSGIYEIIGNHDDYNLNWHLDSNRHYTSLEKLNKIKFFKHLGYDRKGRNIASTWINMVQITDDVIAGLLGTLLFLRIGEEINNDEHNENDYDSDNDD